ncbi:XRE family transcriptional regulator [Streptomyces hebeiensis]
MPRWKALPDGIDPEIKEFTGQLRGLVDRSGLSIAAVADRTGYSKTSWERYLNGRLLAPKGAIVALAEVTGTQPVHLTTMWELAERAWSRAEMRHDMTMEAIRISQARAALGEGSVSSGVGEDPGARHRRGAGAKGPGTRTKPKDGTGRGERTEPGAAGAGESAGATGKTGPGGLAEPAGSAGAAGVAGTSSWQARPPSVPVQATPPPGHAPGHAAGAPGAAPAGPRRGRPKAAVFAAGIVGALLLVAAAVLLTDIGGDSGESTLAEESSPPPSPSKSAPSLPAGVLCSGEDCTGKDPEEMGCGGEYAQTTSNATVGTALIEVRYSETCGAAWARITQAVAGDEVRITQGDAQEEGAGKAQTGSVETTNDAYTPMLAVPDAAAAKACATLAAGQTGCTTTP